MTIKRAEHSRLTRLGFVSAALGMAIAIAGLPMNPAGANDPGPPGDNGTVKIDGVALDDGPGHSNQPNDPDETDPDNDPHVTCGFQVEFFNFDTGQLADITFTAHPPTGNNGVLSDQSLVLISDDGTAGAPNDVDAVFDYDVLADFDLTQFTSVHPVHGWHVKLNITVYDADGKKVPGAQKHKVFWVDPCEAPPPPPCEPTTANNQCTPCPPGQTPTGQGGCTSPQCVPDVANNQCTPCPPGQTPTGQGACTPPPPPPPNPEVTPVDECPDQEGFQTNPDQCLQVLPEVVDPPAAPPTEVLGEVVTRAPELPRTGTSTLPLLELGVGLILFGLVTSLYGRKRAATI